MGDEDEMLIPQAAAELKISRWMVWKHVRAKHLPARKIGRDWLIRRADLEEFKATRRKPGRPPAE